VASGRRSGELIRGVFQILLPQPDGLPFKDVLDQLEELVPPSVSENGAYPTRPNARRYVSCPHHHDSAG
jgi:hypothetical protein